MCVAPPLHTLQQGPSPPPVWSQTVALPPSPLSLTATNTMRDTGFAVARPASDCGIRPVLVGLQAGITEWNASEQLLEGESVKRLGHSSRLHRTLVIMRRVSTGTIPVLSAAIAMNPENLESTHPVLATAATLADDWAWLGIFACSCVVGGCAWAIQNLGDPRIHAVVDEVLNRFRDGVFGHDDGDYAHHRVTLFKHHGFRLLGFDINERGWPLSGWLVPIARSGHTAQKTNVRFLAPDNTDRARGIAGRAWAALSKTASATSLPDVQRNPTSADIQQYAEQTNVTESWVKKRRPGTRSMVGFTIETPNGKPWGVLVVDSRKPDLDLVQARVLYRHHGKVLGQLVEGTVSTQQTRGRWVRVEPSSYVAPGDAIEVGILISPYDIPDGVRRRLRPEPRSLRSRVPLHGERRVSRP